MALDFPANPTDGQIFGSYVWSASKGVWQSREESAAPAVVSPVPPTTPTPGDIWVDSSDGISYVYYNDGTSSQWIELVSSGVPSINSKANLDGGNLFTGEQTLNTPLAISSGGTGGTTIQEAQQNLQILYSPNYIINGGFDIWQRGTSFSANNTYSADRWVNSRTGGAAMPVSRSTDVPTGVGLQYSISVSVISTSTDGTLTQRIESTEAVKFAGQTVTVSLWAKATTGSSGINWSTSYASSVDNFTTTVLDQSGAIIATPVGGNWVRYSFTFTASANAVNGYEISFIRLGGSANSTLYTGIQLELGSVATPFRRNQENIQAELAACQRYYYRIDAFENTFTAFGQGYANTTTSFRCIINPPSEMRINPTAEWSGSGTLTVRGAAGSTNFTAIATDTVLSSKRVPVVILTSSGLVSNAHGLILANNNTSAWLALNAEL